MCASSSTTSQVALPLAPLDADERLHALDILRGLALFGMILVHFHQKMRLPATGLEDLIGWGRAGRLARVVDGGSCDASGGHGALAGCGHGGAAGRLRRAAPGALAWATSWLVHRHLPPMPVPGTDWPLAYGLGLVQDQWLCFTYIGAVVLLLAYHPMCGAYQLHGASGRARRARLRLRARAQAAALRYLATVGRWLPRRPSREIPG